jgi:hypothetical protein
MKFWIVISIICLTASAVFSAGENPGAVFLMIWPSAKSTSLGGAMTALADDADAAYWNPGGLGFQKGIGWTLTGTPLGWLPGLYPGMFYSYGSAGYGFSNFPVSQMNLNVGVNYTYITTGRTEVINEQGEYLGEYTTYDIAVGIHGGIRLIDNLGLGLNIKYIYSFLVPDWVFIVMQKELGNITGGTGSTIAADIGALYKPFHSLSVGLSLANIGPNIAYTTSGSSDPLPRMLRVGLCWTPIDDEIIRVRVIPEVNKVLVGMFYDPNDTMDFGQKLSYEWKEAWKSFGFEATVLRILSLRGGYFEDIYGARGGVRIVKEDREEYLSLTDYLFSKHDGKINKIGLTFGLGLGYKDYVRLEASTDNLIYDFQTSNLKIALTVNNIEGLLRELK